MPVLISEPFLADIQNLIRSKQIHTVRTVQSDTEDISNANCPLSACRPRPPKSQFHDEFHDPKIQAKFDQEKRMGWCIARTRFERDQPHWVQRYFTVSPPLLLPSKSGGQG